MALNKNFYNEIFENENKWSNQIHSGLMNSIFCDRELKPFYKKKRHSLKQEMENNQTHMIEPILNTIEEILRKIEEFHVKYNVGIKPDMYELIPLFLTSQMNNEQNEDLVSEVEELQIRNEVLKSFRDNYKITEDEPEDYLYDDFPDEPINTK